MLSLKSQRAGFNSRSGSLKSVEALVREASAVVDVISCLTLLTPMQLYILIMTNTIFHVPSMVLQISMVPQAGRPGPSLPSHSLLVVIWQSYYQRGVRTLNTIQPTFSLMRSWFCCSKTELEELFSTAQTRSARLWWQGAFFTTLQCAVGCELGQLKSCGMEMQTFGQTLRTCRLRMNDGRCLNKLHTCLLDFINVFIVLFFNVK